MQPETMLHAIDSARTAGMPYTGGYPSPEAIRYLRIRRGFEVALLVATLPFTLPIGAVVALAIRLDSTGPIFFRQLRPGRGGIPFGMIKFRSMVARSEQGSPSTSVDDPRITRIGRLIRRTRLDELPQLWNVLRGEMSLIGPRPEPVEKSRLAEQSIPGYRSRWVIDPGLTGLAQVEQGYVEGIEGMGRKLELDMHYIKHISPRLDALILLKTIRTIITGAGAR